LRAANKSFGAILRLLWFRLITISVIGLLFAATLRDSPSRIGGWLYYLTIWEVLFEIAVRVTAVALMAVAVGTLITAAVAPFLRRRVSRECFAERVTRTAVVVAAFDVFGIVLRALLHWAHLWKTTIVLVCYCAAFAVALCIPRTREWLMTSLDQFLGEKAAGRTAIAIAILTATVVAGELALGMMATGVVRAAAPAVRPPGPNILLITFDALSAEDMSLYGYRLPTTPRIEEFARKSTVFTSFFSASTFTTPSIATILTGIYPSEHHVYHLQGHLSRADAARTLPHLLRAGKYLTGASLSNPFAYFLAAQLGAEYDALPVSPHGSGAFMNVWDALGMLHQQRPFGSPAAEFDDFGSAWNSVTSVWRGFSRFGQTKSEFPASTSFAQAKELLARMPAGFFLWIHVFAPHSPYLPGPLYSGRFLPSGEMRTAEAQGDFPELPHYAPINQKLVDKARLRYDEFVAESDGALGAFLGELESAGRLRDTAVIISADHGESFEGGVYTHFDEDQVSPEIHIPLIIHMPGQGHGSRVAVTADQTSLAPTILDIAGRPRPDYMRGPSLLPLLTREDTGHGESMAFTQHLAGNSIFKPLKTGTVGVIEGSYQYVLDLATGKAKLRGLAESQFWYHDRSPEDPALAKRLREAIYSRFPDLPRKPE
jgi:arylsulfatase A-like enzyme